MKRKKSAKAKRTTSKKITARIKAGALRVKKTSKKIADDVLLKMGPSVQSQMEKLNRQIKAQSESMTDFKVMGLKVLQKAKDMSESLKKPQNKPRKKSKKKNG